MYIYIYIVAQPGYIFGGGGVNKKVNINKKKVFIISFIQINKNVVKKLLIIFFINHDIDKTSIFLKLKLFDQILITILTRTYRSNFCKGGG